MKIFQGQLSFLNPSFIVLEFEFEQLLKTRMHRGGNSLNC